MNPNTIRSIDYWIGKPICFFLTLFSSTARQSANKPGKIIFLKFIEQGATVLAFGAIKQAAELVGRENVYFCVFKNNRPILDILDIVPQENIITLSDKSLLRFISGSFSALRKIRKNKIDTVIDFEFFSRASAIFSFLTGAKTRVGLHRFTSELPYRGNLMTHRVHYNPYLHTSAFYYSLVEASLQDPSGVPLTKVPQSSLPAALPVFAPKEQERQEMSGLLAKKDGETIILLNPNASDLLPLRKWESEKFILLGKKILAENPHVRIIITGAPSEQKSAEEICLQIGSDRAVSFAGKTTMRELLVLYSLADILVTNDSGPGHFSALTNIKTIILFGPETPKLFGPISPNATVIWKELACSPCVSVFNHRFSPCNNNVCMKSISVEEVYRVIKEKIESRE